MTRKPTVVVVEGGGRRGAPLTKAEARQLAAETAAAREQRRKGRTLYRLSRHLAPWWAAGAVMALGATTWAIRALVDPQTAITAAGLAACIIGFIGWLIGRRAGRWRHRVYVAAGAAALWLAYTAQVGPGWRPPLALLAATIVLAAKWWATIRIPHPKAPTRVEPERQVGPLEQLWAENIADQQGALPRSHLTGKDTSNPNATKFTVELRPGKQTITQMLGALERIAGGLMVPVKRVVLEPHPNENPNQGLLTVVKTSPIDKTVAYRGARITGTHRHILELGPYGDGDGYAPWRMWAPGEKPMTGSWLSGFVVGGTGIGKSRLMELLAAGYMASGVAVVWFADPQGGASSPALQEYADWYVDSDGVPIMLAALERIAKARELENSVEGWTRFDPSPARPGIVVFLDECQVTFGKYGKRWADLARKTQKVGISIVGFTQYASLENLGGQEPLRASLLTNAIVMKTNSKTNAQLIAGLDFDSEQLPKIPGFGYIIRADASGRTAPFRAEYVADPEEWFARYPMPPLDALSVHAADAPYELRRETAVQLQETNRRKVAEMRTGRPVPLPLEDEPEGETGPSVPVFPPAPTLHVVPNPEKSGPELGGNRDFRIYEVAQPDVQQGTGRDRILTALEQGPGSPKMLRDATGLGETRVATLLKELRDAGDVEQVGRGLYRLTGKPE